MNLQAIQDTLNNWAEEIAYQLSRGIVGDEGGDEWHNSAIQCEMAQQELDNITRFIIIETQSGIVTDIKEFSDRAKADAYWVQCCAQLCNMAIEAWIAMPIEEKASKMLHIFSESSHNYQWHTLQGPEDD